MGSVGTAQFDELYAQYYAKFVIIARRYVRDTTAAEDLVMESFTSFWENRSKIASDTNLPAYIAVTVKNNCLNWLNSRQLHLAKQRDIHDLQSRLVAANIRSLSSCDPHKLFSDEIRGIVETEMKRMPLITRQVFELSRFYGKTYAEIAASLGISQRRVASEMQRALSFMRDALKDYLPLQIIIWLLSLSLDSFS